MKLSSIAGACVVGLTVVACGKTSTSGGPDADAGAAGVPSASGADAGADNGGSAGAPVAASPVWLAFENPDGVFAYDTRNYPDPNKAVKLGAPPTLDYFFGGSAPEWSPDGKSVAYVSGDSLVVWDMTGSLPSAAKTLATGLVPSITQRRIQWSPDSSSLAFTSGEQLLVLDPAAATPVPRQITAHVYYWGFAPQGNGLAYTDVSGANLISVTSGVASNLQKASDMPIAWGWSPDGLHLGMQSDAQDWLLDVSEATLKSTPVFPTGANPEIQFSFDGTFMSFNGADSGEQIQYLSVADPSTVIPIAAPMEPSGGAPVWHPSRSALLFHSQSASWFMADLSNPRVKVKAVPVPASSRPVAWLPNGLSLLFADFSNTQLSLVDMSVATPVAVPFARQSQPILDVKPNSTGTAIAFVTTNTLHLMDPARPKDAGTTLPIVDDSSAALGFQWSQDGRFIFLSLLQGSLPQPPSQPPITNQTLLLVRADGTVPSPVIPLGPSTEGVLGNASWPH